MEGLKQPIGCNSSYQEAAEEDTDQDDVLTVEEDESDDDEDNIPLADFVNREVSQYVFDTYICPYP